MLSTSVDVGATQAKRKRLRARRALKGAVVEIEAASEESHKELVQAL